MYNCDHALVQYRESYGCAVQYGKQALVGHCDISVTSLWYHCADCRALTGCSQEKRAGGGETESRCILKRYQRILWGSKEAYKP